MNLIAMPGIFRDTDRKTGDSNIDEMRAGATNKLWLPAAMLAALSVTHAALGNADPQIPPFSGMQAGAEPAPWREAYFSNRPRTTFTLVEDAQTAEVVLRAESRASASAMLFNVDADPREFPVMRWRWKISNLIESGDLTRKSGDDFPARLYVNFDYDISKLRWGERTKLRLARFFYREYVPAAALCYVWDRSASVGTVADNAYTDRVRMIVVQSGPDKLRTWVSEARDIRADFLRAFGEKPPKIVSIALASDSDDTGESATAWFGDIELLAADRDQ